VPPTKRKALASPVSDVAPHPKKLAMASPDGSDEDIFDYDDEDGSIMDYDDGDSSIDDGTPLDDVDSRHRHGSRLRSITSVGGKECSESSSSRVSAS
jgi:hypothetical protein